MVAVDTTMTDIVFVTGEAVRYDHIAKMEFLSELDPVRGISAGHYTRPSLSALHSSSYASAIQTKPVSPTIGEVLDRAGYTCIGITTNPQAQPNFGFDAGYSFYENFVDKGTRGSKLREFVGRFSLAQRIYQRLFPLHSRRDNRPSDLDVVEMAIEKFNQAEPPRFLWVHLMESHRPYGIGDNGISPELNRKAKFSPRKVTEEEHQLITREYSKALARVDEYTKSLLHGLDSKPIFAFAGDHGELLGENGTYFHPPHEKHLNPEITDVPVAFDGISCGSEPVSHIDIPPTILSNVGIEPPDEWQGLDISEETRRSFLTWAPWMDTTDALWQMKESRIHLKDAEAEFRTDQFQGAVDDIEKSEEVKERLRDFGYLE